MLTRRRDNFLTAALDGGDWPHSLRLESKRQGNWSSTEKDKKNDWHLPIIYVPDAPYEYLTSA
jgi:hypothetical protein